jgi:hypothetical protein
MNLAAEDDGSLTNQLNALDKICKDSKSVHMDRARAPVQRKFNELLTQAQATRATLVQAAAVQSTLKQFLSLPVTAAEEEIAKVYGAVRKAMIDAKRLKMNNTIYATHAQQKLLPHQDRMVGLPSVPL